MTRSGDSVELFSIPDLTNGDDRFPHRADLLANLVQAIENRDAGAARRALRFAASPGNMTFHRILELCVTLKAIASDSDTLSAIAYALWELEMPRLDGAKPQIVDFLLELMSTSSNPSVHNYASLLLQDYARQWSKWTRPQLQQLSCLCSSSPEESNRSQLQTVRSMIEAQ